MQLTPKEKVKCVREQIKCEGRKQRIITVENERHKRKERNKGLRGK